MIFSLCRRGSRIAALTWADPSKPFAQLGNKGRDHLCVASTGDQPTTAIPYTHTYSTTDTTSIARPLAFIVWRRHHLPLPPSRQPCAGNIALCQAHCLPVSVGGTLCADLHAPERDAVPTRTGVERSAKAARISWLSLCQPWGGLQASGIPCPLRGPSSSPGATRQTRLRAI